MFSSDVWIVVDEHIAEKWLAFPQQLNQIVNVETVLIRYYDLDLRYYYYYASILSGLSFLIVSQYKQCDNFNSTEVNIEAGNISKAIIII